MLDRRSWNEMAVRPGQQRSPTVAVCAVLFAAFSGCTSMTTRPAAASAPPVQSAGAKIFAKWCGDCHTRPTGSGTMALQRKYEGRFPAILEQRTDLRAPYVQVVVRNGVSFMPSFRKTEISDAELALVGAYLERSQ